MAGGLVRRNQLGPRSKEKRIPEKLVVLLFERLGDKNIILHIMSH